jgi:hypothetical protein
VLRKNITLQTTLDTGINTGNYYRQHYRHQYRYDFVVVGAVVGVAVVTTNKTMKHHPYLPQALLLMLLPTVQATKYGIFFNRIGWTWSVSFSSNKRGCFPLSIISAYVHPGLAARQAITECEDEFMMENANSPYDLFVWLPYWPLQ